MNPLSQPILLELYGSLVTRLQQRGDTRQNAEDAAQELFCDLDRHPKTMEFIVKNSESILQGKIPGRLLPHYRSKARLFSVGSKRGTVLLSDDLLLVDEMSAREQMRSVSILSLIEQEPFLSKSLEAMQYGCKTNKEIAEFLRMPERTWYAQFRAAKQRLQAK